MPVKFQIKGDGRDAWYASSLARAIVPRQADANYAVITDATAGIFGGKYLNSTNNPRTYHIGLDNCPNTGRAITVLWRGIPTFTGLPPTGIAFCEMGNASGGNLCGGISGAIGTDGKLFMYGAQQHNASNFTFNASFGTAISFTNFQALDIWFVWDGTAGTNKAELWVAQNGTLPVRIATMTASRANDLWDKYFMPYISPWESLANNASNANRMHLNEFVVWDEVIDPTTFGIRTGFITTSIAAFEGYGYTDPGVSKVLSPASGGPANYIFAGLTKIGTYTPPTAALAATTKHGVAASDGLGSYRGADLWDAVAATELKHGLTRNQDGTAVLGSYTGSDLWDAIIAAELKHDLVRNQNGVPITGTYRGADLWDAITAGQLMHGLSKLQNGATIAGSYRGSDLYTALTAGQIKHGLTPLVDGTAVLGTYDGSDLFDVVAPDKVQRGFDYLSAGIPREGTLDTVTNVIEQIDMHPVGDQITMTMELI